MNIHTTRVWATRDGELFSARRQILCERGHPPGGYPDERQTPKRRAGMNPNLSNRLMRCRNSEKNVMRGKVWHRLAAPRAAQRV